MERIEETLQIDFTKEAEEGLTSLSLSKIIGLISTPADQEQMLENTYKKHFNNPESEYYHMTKDEIKAKWEAKGAASCAYGRMNDDYIAALLEGDETDMEMFKLDNDVDNDERLAGLIKSTDDFFKAFTASGDIVLIAREAPVHFTFNSIDINGRIDSLFYNKATKKYIIVDYKTSKSIDQSNRWKKLLGPAKMFDDCNYVTYTHQGYTYKYALLNSYLPENVTEADVDFFIVQLPGFELPNGKWFEVYTPAFKYSKEYMENIFEYAEKKTQLLAKMGKQ